MMTKQQIIKDVIIPIEAAGFKAYFVGGCVRDELTGKTPHDYDISTNATPDEINKIFGVTGTRKANLYGVAMPIINGEQVEIATWRSDLTRGRHPTIKFSNKIEDDAFRRDFTVNALYEDRDGNIIDPTGMGLKDIETNTLRFVGKAVDRITEDPLRIFRYARFVASKGFAANEEDVAEIEKHILNTGTAFVFADVSVERQCAELIKTFGGKDFSMECFDMMDRLGIFSAINLDVMLAQMAKAPQNPKWHSEGDVEKHTRLVVEAAIKRAKKIEDEKERFVLVMAALLHDCGKPESGRKNGINPKNGYPRTKDHAEVGAKIAYKFLRDLKLDCATAHRIEGLVANHMKMHQLGMMDKKFSIMSVLNLPDFDLLCELCRSDSDGCIKTAVDDDEVNIDEALASPKIASLIGQPIPAPIVTGDDLIALGFKPSEKFRKALEVAHKDQVNNGKTDKAILISNIKGLLK